MSKALLLLTFFSISTVWAKPKCRPITKKAIIDQYGEVVGAQLIGSRKVKLAKGKNLMSVVKADVYSYSNPTNIAKWIKITNGLNSDVATRDIMVSLPLCSKSDIKRSIASTPEIKKKISTSRATSDKGGASLFTQYGNVNVLVGSDTLSLTYVKMGGAYTLKGSGNMNYRASLMGTKFMNIVHSDSDDALSPESFYPEASLSAGKTVGKVNFGLGYDYLNYFVQTSDDTYLNLEAVVMHRIGLRSVFFLSESFNAHFGVGGLRSFGDEAISGVDTSAGISYSFGKNKRYSLSTGYYQSSLLANEEDNTSKSYSLGFAINF